MIENIIKWILGEDNSPQYDEYAKLEDYQNIGITSEIIITKQPSFIWNIDEKKIVQYPDTFWVNNGVLEVKPGNRMVNVQTYDNIPIDMINKINSGYGIGIMTKSWYEVETPRDTKYYRFSILPTQ
jgi:intein/homing endonuclease